MKNGADIPWKRLSTEVAAIVGSIMLAFWIDAWWDEQADRRQERALLEALQNDFQTARDIFDATTNSHYRVYQSMEKFLYWAEQGSVPEDEIESADYTLGSVFYRGTFEPPMGAVDTLLASGRLDLLGSPELVAELTRWKALVDKLNSDEIAAANHFYQTIYPYLSKRLNIQDLDKGIPYPGGVPWPQQQADSHLLVSDREFHNIIYVHWVLQWNIDHQLPGVDSALKKITELVEMELVH